MYNAVLHVALPTALRAADGSKGGLTNIPRVESPAVDWLYANEYARSLIGCMQMSSYTGVRNCSGKNNLAPGGGGGHFHYWRWWGRAAGQGMIFRSSPLTQDTWIGLIGYWRATPFITGLLPSPQCLWQAHDLGSSDATVRAGRNRFLWMYDDTAE